MKFHPIKYRQPIFGDSRCALYSLANILDDKGILMFNNVNESRNSSFSEYGSEWLEMAD